MLTIPNTTEELLSSIVKVLSLEIRGKICVGYQAIALSTSTVSALSPPSGAISAEVTLEIPDASSAKMVGARYTLHGVNPVTGNTPDKTGIPIGDGDTIELRGGDNISAFRVIDSGNGPNTRYLKIIYFK
jgi:hypothetical protein